MQVRFSEKIVPLYDLELQYTFVLICSLQTPKDLTQKVIYCYIKT